MCKSYVITFATRKNGTKGWIVHIDAKDAASARKIAEMMWLRDSRYADMHRFGVQCRRLKPTEAFRHRYFTQLPLESYLRFCLAK